MNYFTVSGSEWGRGNQSAEGRWNRTSRGNVVVSMTFTTERIIHKFVISFPTTGNDVSDGEEAVEAAIMACSNF